MLVAYPNAALPLKGQREMVGRKPMSGIDPVADLGSRPACALAPLAALGLHGLDEGDPLGLELVQELEIGLTSRFVRQSTPGRTEVERSGEVVQSFGRIIEGPITGTIAVSARGSRR